jgi:hypothetical protein
VSWAHDSVQAYAPEDAGTLDGESLVAQLVRLRREWINAGRPDPADLGISVQPDTDPTRYRLWVGHPGRVVAAAPVGADA